MKKIWMIHLLVFAFLLIPSEAKSQTWDSARRLSWNSSDSNEPCLVVDTSNRVHVVWHDNGPGNYEIYYRKSTDSGTTWSAVMRLTWNSGDSLNPAIAADSGGNIHVVWDDITPGRREIYYRKSTNGGVTWSATKRLTNLAGHSRFPSIAIDTSNRIHVVWFDVTPGNNEIYYTRSTNSGSAWVNPKRMTWNASSSRYPFIAAGSGNDIHLVWQDNAPGNDEIYYRKSTDGGTGWLTAKRLTWNSGFSRYPRVISDLGNNVHVVWTDRTPGNYEVFYKKSTSGGTNWPVTKRLTWNSGTSATPAIKTDAGNNIFVVWSDLSPGNYEVFYKRSTNGGSAWTFKRLTWNGGASAAPEIATYSTGDIHVAWADDTPQNNEIYYRRTEASVPPTQTVTRFHNNTVYPIISLKIDGVEQFPTAGTGYMPGYYYQIELSPGWHNYEASTGIWEYGSRNLFYIYTGSFQQLSDQIKNIYINNPSINFLLTQGHSYGDWLGEWISPFRAFRFYNNGNYDYYVNGTYQSSGTYSLISYEAYKVTFSLSPLGTVGYYWDVVGGYFSMKFADNVTDQFYGTFPTSANVIKQK